MKFFKICGVLIKKIIYMSILTVLSFIHFQTIYYDFLPYLQFCSLCCSSQFFKLFAILNLNSQYGLLLPPYFQCCLPTWPPRLPRLPRWAPLGPPPPLAPRRGTISPFCWQQSGFLPSNSLVLFALPAPWPLTG